MSTLVSRSRLGFGLACIRMNETTAAGAGVDAARLKTAAFTLSANIAGVAAALYASWIGYIQPTDVYDVMWSVRPIVAALIGRVGTVFGPVVGTLVYVFLEEVLAAQPPHLRHGRPRSIRDRVAARAAHRRTAFPAAKKEGGMSEPLLRIENLTRRFGDLTSKRSTAVRQPPGARDRRADRLERRGEDDLVNLVTGHLKPTAGRVFFAGRKITGVPPHKLARLGLLRTLQVV